VVILPRIIYAMACRVGVAAAGSTRTAGTVNATVELLMSDPELTDEIVQVLCDSFYYGFGGTIGDWKARGEWDDKRGRPKRFYWLRRARG
jgi:hypothetical protein